MKMIITGSAIVLTTLTGSAFAACPTPSAARTVANDTQIGQIVNGNYACAIRGSERWNEQHVGGPASGQVIDYKLGPNHPLDPSKQVGSYTIAAGTGGTPATITYNYGSGGSYEYCISPAGTGVGTYGFYNVSTGDVFRVRVQSSPCVFP